MLRGEGPHRSSLERRAKDPLRIVGGHVGVPWLTEMISLCTKYPNVFVDTSAYAAAPAVLRSRTCHMCRLVTRERRRPPVSAIRLLPHGLLRRG